MSHPDYYLRASAEAMARAEAYRKSNTLRADENALSEMWHHVKMREHARTLAKQAKAVKP